MWCLWKQQLHSCVNWVAWQNYCSPRLEQTCQQHCNRGTGATVNTQKDGISSVRLCHIHKSVCPFTHRSHILLLLRFQIFANKEQLDKDRSLNTTAKPLTFCPQKQWCTYKNSSSETARRILIYQPLNVWISKLIMKSKVFHSLGFTIRTIISKITML